jgi:uncharacterized protein (TIGR04255 family)
MTPLPPPLSGEAPPEVHLPNAPLVWVVGQIRFPTILAIRNPDRVAGFQETIRAIYPTLRQDRVQHLVLSGSEHIHASPGISTGLIWRFVDNETAWRWKVSLATDYVSLETRDFKDIEAFSERLRLIIGALEEVFDPQEAHRIGIRYVDRLVGPGYTKIAEFLRPEVLGLAATALEPAAQQFGIQAVLETEEGQMFARWGKLPPRATVDPEIEPLEEQSWVIDLDMFTQVNQKFVTDDLISTATRFSKRIYAVFRWMVNDNFLRFYGGKP